MPVTLKRKMAKKKSIIKRPFFSREVAIAHVRVGLNEKIIYQLFLC